MRSHDWAERDLAERFRDLRLADERSAPPFARVWQAALTQRHALPRPRYLSLPIAAALMLLAVGISVAIFRTSPTQRAKATQLSQWLPPTDFLMHSPNQTLFQTVPQVGKVVVGLASISSTTHTGGQK